MSAKEELEQELEQLDQRRGELQDKIKKADPQQMHRDKFFALSPEEQAKFMRGGGKLYD